MRKITAVILCGGSGTRLWPLSRKNFPKQFLNLTGDKTLFQKTIERIVSIEDSKFQIEEILIVTNENHRFLVLEQLDALEVTMPTRILLEPTQRNTAPALTLAVIAAAERDPDSIIVAMPSDHYVKDLNSFLESMRLAICAVNDKTIVVLGIEPTSPNTGFGYIEFKGNCNVRDVIAFKEKPCLEEAKKMIEKGTFAWNGGIFIHQSKTWLHAIQESSPDIFDSINTSWQRRTTDEWFIRPDIKEFNGSRSISIDYAVMEEVSMLGIAVKLVLLNAGWSDLGSFSAIEEIESKDGSGNIFKGDILALNSKNNIAITSKKTISLLGVNDLIIVDSGDALLVANKKDSQSIKELVKLLEVNHSNLLDENRVINRPWGWFELIEEGSSHKVKHIQINPGRAISLQKHQKRSEHWVVVKGEAMITKDKKSFKLYENQSTFIEKDQIHRIENKTEKMLHIIEVQSGSYLGEDDIIRIEDKYGR